MLGSQIARYFYNIKKYNIVYVIINKKKFNLLNIKDNKSNIFLCDLDNVKKLEKIIKINKPDYLINCVGMVKQIMNSNNRKLTYFLNVTIPKKLNKLALCHNFKVIHFSTDCVFSGADGNYSEKKTPDCKDFYGITKLKGEVKSSNTINLRTSIIGHEIDTEIGLLEWFLNSKKKSMDIKMLHSLD